MAGFSKDIPIVALIPARGGSKGIPRKNLAMLQGRPLISHSIEAALFDPRINRVYVSSDDPEILDLARQSGAEPLLRPGSLAGDSSPMLPVMQHAIDAFFGLDESAKVKKDGLLMLLQPSSPLRSGTDVRRALDVFLSSGAGALISTVREDAKCLKNFFTSEDGFLRGIVNDEFPFMQRQELPAVFRPNGAIYIYRFSDLMRGCLMPPSTIGFEMSLASSIDIDTPEDLACAEQMMSAARGV